MTNFNNNKKFNNKNRGGNNMSNEKKYSYGEPDENPIMDNLKDAVLTSSDGTNTVGPNKEQSSGIKRKPFQIAGYIINPSDLQRDVTNMLASVGVNPKAVHSVKITGGHKGDIEITATVKADAVKETFSQNANKGSLIGISDRTQGKFRIRRDIYNGLRNSAFVNELHWQKEKIKGDNYIVLNFDPEVLICNLCNIPYDDGFVKISTIPIQASRKTCKKLGYVPCAAVVTFNIAENKNRGFDKQQVIDFHRDDKED